ncbi:MULTISPECIES: hypothetical protein [unclassified Bacteroides]|jgi:hypothetical protein|uniref:hypothetical protein n=1 Tax=unclassified Bacteroides TaxID=2646097 RepID=UPI001F4158D1|nr:MULTISPECIES: hypothetical protein [unclassified Bacteroides]
MRGRIIILFMLLCGVFAVTNAQMKKPYEWKDYESVFGVKEGLRFYDFDVTPIYSSAPANIFWPGDKIEFQFQLKNNLDNPIDTEAKVYIIQYGTKGIPNNVWLPQVIKMDYEKVIPMHISISPKGYTNLSVSVDDINKYGGYAIVFDLGENGRRLGTSFVYSIQASPVKMQYPKQALDDLGVDFLGRIGVQAIRYGLGYLPTTNPGYRKMMQDFEDEMKRYMDNNITVLVMIGEGGSLMPLGIPRPHLDENGYFLRTKQDYVWLPDMDDDFKSFVKEICLKYGWPKGPVTAVSLWNEPWEGISISGWQADMIRYREIYTKMAEAVVECRKEGADVLVGGGDSNSNALDKFFADGTMDMLPIFDFLSIHYQGMESPVIYPEWNNRKYHKGKVLIWDTESWVGNTDDRIGLVVAANRSAGYDRSMGIYGGYMYSGKGDAKSYSEIQTANGIQKIPTIHSTWSATAAMGATQSLIGEREFNRLLFHNSLPWVMLFDGYNSNEEDGTIVIAGDLGEAFGKDNMLFRNVNGLSTGHSITDGKMTVIAKPTFRLYDFYGNIISPRNGKYEIPLNYQGYFMRTNGKKGSFKQLVTALKTAKVDGYEPVNIIAKDFTAPILVCPEMDLEITNILNRDVTGSLKVNLGSLNVIYPSKIRLKGNETRTVKVKVEKGDANSDNTYPLEVIFDAGKDGIAKHIEDMHVNVISKRTIQVDGNLDDWNGAIPQVVRGSDKASISLTEAAWYPFQNFDNNAEGLAHAYLGYDEQYFYFAAKIADKTPNKGTFRFEYRDDDQFFYPDTSYMQTIHAMQSVLVKQSAEVDNKMALMQPQGDGRILNYIENTQTTQSIGIDIDLPMDKMVKTSFYFPNIAQHGVSVVIYDRETGKELLTENVDKLWNGVYLSFNLSGKVRVRCSAYGWWYTAKLAGVFFDETTISANGKVSAKSAGRDFDTCGDWKGVYGTSGYYIMGLPDKTMLGILCNVVSQDDLVPLKWPEGVRRFTYRKRPTLPDGTTGERFDNILIAFNVLPIGEDGMEAHSKGTMPRYIGYKCTDYEYALNTVAPEYGGGFEIWRMLVPGMPRKHFYPRQGKSFYDGAVKDGKLMTVRKGNTLYTECAIPWSEIPHVRQALDKGEKIKFSFRVNDDGAPAACMELAKERSVSKKNSRAFHPDWKEHWANEVEFGFEE